jgi:hypothetical protein
MSLRRVERVLWTAMIVTAAALVVFLAAWFATAEAHKGCHSKMCERRVLNDDRREQIRKLTPYRCATGRWAVPCYIVACESRGLWGAWNRSGAAGPYQIMPMHGRPFPANSLRKRLVHHRIASRLWAGGRGASHWMCA